MSNFDFWWNTYYSVFKLQPNTNTNTIRVWKIMRIRIRIYSVLKNHPNTNTNTIRFENICRIRIRISLFGLNYSNTIRIPNYSLISGLEHTAFCLRRLYSCLQWKVFHMAYPLSKQSLDATLTVGNACEFPTRSNIFFKTRVAASSADWRWNFRFLYFHPVVNSWIAEDSFTFLLYIQEYGGTWKKHFSACVHLSPLQPISTFSELRHPLDLIYRDSLSSSITYMHHIQEYGGTWYNTLLLPVIALASNLYFFWTQAPFGLDLPWLLEQFRHKLQYCTVTCMYSKGRSGFGCGGDSSLE